MKKYIANNIDIEKRYFLNMKCGRRIDTTSLLNLKVDQIEQMCCNKCCVLKYTDNADIEVVEG